MGGTSLGPESRLPVLIRREVSLQSWNIEGCVCSTIGTESEIAGAFSGFAASSLVHREEALREPSSRNQRSLD